MVPIYSVSWQARDYVPCVLDLNRRLHLPKMLSVVERNDPTKSMSATSFHTTLLLECKELYRFLAKCQQMSHQQGTPHIASISLEVPPIDPLAVLNAICYPQPQHFYLEKPDFWAIAALGSTTKLTYSHNDRFSMAQEFIQNYLFRTLSTGYLHLPFSGIIFSVALRFFSELDNTTIFSSATVFFTGNSNI